VTAQEAYPWSSYRANALGETDTLICPHTRYLDLGATAQARLAAYRELFADQLSAELLDKLRSGTNGGFVVGSGHFERQIAAMVGRRTWRGSPGRPRKAERDGEQRALPL
jgi:hypothetical protein